MKKTLLAAFAAATLLLAGCAQGSPAAQTPGHATAVPDNSQGDAKPDDSDGSQAPPSPGMSSDADEATLAYLDCLTEHGLNAVIGPDGTIQYAVTAEDFGNGDEISAGSNTDQARIEALCQKAVPNYTAPDYNDK